MDLSYGELKASLHYLLRPYLKVKGGKKLRETVYNTEVEGNILKSPKQTENKEKQLQWSSEHP